MNRRHPPLSTEKICERLSVDINAGKAYWVDATKYHNRLNGSEAGCPRKSGAGKLYWHIKINGIAYRRSAIVFAVANGYWPSLTIDHINGNSLDDRESNLREATITQNAWNHKGRAKSSGLPMGIRKIGEKYQARIAVNKKTIYLGMHATAEGALAVYLKARLTHFGEFA